ncbi:lipase family protein [Bacillus mycoides]|uniref:Fungal lipase-type domain-containing protein n=1 Tax=Bacillus mycoides TaxID=1405 RepID=A0ABC9R1S6_BACMY|nr:DUF6792 domain-containing protein [Bacillus mycoides]EJR39499.1 hypothetical protein III_03340 [Bacillus mycoides]
MARYRLSSDQGKLALAGEEIYAYEKGELSKGTLLADFNAEIVAEEINDKSGFSAYALQDKTTKEIVIVYVGTQPGKDDNADVKTDAEIGIHNLTNSNVIKFGGFEKRIMVEQYDEADKFYRRVKREFNDEFKLNKISITGHSLGGGLADTVALRNQKDKIDVLTLNPAPVLNRDVIKFGDGFDRENIRNVINENDPLHLGINVGDFIIPGKMYKILNGSGHSYAFTDNDFDDEGDLKALKTIISHNDTGFDFVPGYLELVSSAGSLYKGLVNRELYFGEELLAEAGIISAMNLPVVSGVLEAITISGDLSAGQVKLERIKIQVKEGLENSNQKYEHIKSKAMSEAVKFSIVATIEIKGAVDTAVEWIETTLAKCKEKVLEVLESVFNTAINFLAGSVAVYLATSEILEIAKEVAASYVQDLLDLFKGDFVVDTNIAAIVSEHILSHRHSLLNLFMNDNSRGINRSLLGEIAKDVKELSKDLKQLNDDVSEAVFSMFAKDEELGAVSYY